jgi:flagellum-specific peptidoglycan hydrolase FlgJ
MMKNYKFLLIGAVLVGILLYKPVKKKVKKMVNEADKKKFINQVSPYLMQISKKIGVPYQFLLAQTALETGWGKSELFAKHFNPGGIKARKGEPFVIYPSPEYINGKRVIINSKFVKYPTILDGLMAHTKVLTNVNFKKYANQTNDPVKYAALLNSGPKKYATDPAYTSKIKSLVDQFANLT